MQAEFYKYAKSSRGFSRLLWVLFQQLPKLLHFLLGNRHLLQQRADQAHKLGLVAVGIDRGGKVFLPGHSGQKGPSVGLAPFHEACLPDQIFLEHAIEQNVDGAVLPGFFPGMGQKIGPGQWLSHLPQHIHDLHFTSGQFHIRTSRHFDNIIPLIGIFCQLFIRQKRKLFPEVFYSLFSISAFFLKNFQKRKKKSFH